MVDSPGPPEVPAWVRQLRGTPADRGALERLRRKVATPPEVERGGLYDAQGAGGNSESFEMVLVTDVHPQEGFVEVCLAHDDVEAATEYDIVLEPVETGAGTKVVISADMVGVVGFEQLRTRLGKVSNAVTQLLPAGSEGRWPDAYHTQVGLPLMGVLDWRWTFKESQVDDIQAICGDCTARLLEEDGRASDLLDEESTSDLFVWETLPSSRQDRVIAHVVYGGRRLPHEVLKGLELEDLKGNVRKVLVEDLKKSTNIRKVLVSQ